MSWVNWDGWVTFLFRSWRLSVVNSKCVSISCMCHCLLIVFVFVLSCQVMSPHHSDQMSPRSQVYRIALWRCSLNVLVFVIVFLIVFVFVIVFFWSGNVSLSLWSNVSKVTSVPGNSLTINGFSFVPKSRSGWVSQWLSEWVTRSPIELSDSRPDS